MKKKIPLKMAHRIFVAIVISGVAIGYIGAYAESVALVWLGIGLMFVGLAFNLAHYRCPHCGSHLYRQGGDYCSHCGKRLHE